jgi:hypothetical protein
MAPGLTLSFSTYTVRLERFSGGGAQRSYVDIASLNFSATGSAVQSGNTRAARRLWTVNLLVKSEDAYELEDLYEAWDNLRATGANAIVAITDEVTVRDAGSPLTANTVFTEPVSLEVVGNGNPLYRVSFGLSEV